MQTLEDWIAHTIANASTQFPDAGFVLVVVEAGGDSEMRTIRVGTNMPTEELAATISEAFVDELVSEDGYKPRLDS